METIVRILSVRIPKSRKMEVDCISFGGSSRYFYSSWVEPFILAIPLCSPSPHSRVVHASLLPSHCILNNEWMDKQKQVEKGVSWCNNSQWSIPPLSKTNKEAKNFSPKTALKWLISGFSRHKMNYLPWDMFVHWAEWQIRHLLKSWHSRNWTDRNSRD